MMLSFLPSWLLGLLLTISSEAFIAQPNHYNSHVAGSMGREHQGYQKRRNTRTPMDHSGCILTNRLATTQQSISIFENNTTVEVAPHLNGELTRQKTISVVLNLNARSVTDSTVDLARDVFGDTASIYVTTTEEEAQAIAASLVQSDIVVPIGGDGTLTYCLNLLKKAAAGTMALPEIAYIPLGTGNAVGSVAGCVRKQSRRKSKLRATMEAIRDIVTTEAKPQYSILELPVLEVKIANQTSTLCFFAGAGFDSLMLNDFRILQRWSRRTGLLRNFLGSVAGYCVALVTRTLPAAAVKQRHQVQVKIVASGDEGVLWIDHRRGDFAQTIQDPILYEGQAGIVAASTVPYYGGHLRLFPFARLNLKTMHLRIGRIHPLTGFWNIPRIFAGSYRDTSERFGVLDFLGTEFEVQLRGLDGKEYPFQHSGESVGEIQSFRLKVADEPIRFISFWDTRND